MNICSLYKAIIFKRLGFQLIVIAWKRVFFCERKSYRLFKPLSPPIDFFRSFKQPRNSMFSPTWDGNRKSKRYQDVV